MAKIRHSAGNTLAILAVLVGIILLIGFLVLNYNVLFSLHKEAKTAADAAALEGAKQLATVTVDSRLGKLGLVDQSGDDPNNSFKPAPVISFNSALATARLDLLIAEDLKNKQMVILAKSDLEELRSKSKELAKKLADKFKSGADGYNAVKNVFTANALRAGNKVDEVTISIAVGRVEEGVTSLPIPTPPDDAAKAASVNGLYKASVNIPAYDVPVAFAAISTQPRLVEEKSFIDMNAGNYDVAGFGTIPPSIVKVEADFTVGSLTPGADGKQVKEKLHQLACAMAGGNRLSQSTSTAFAVSFLGGLPAAQQFGGKISIQNLMSMDSAWKMPSGQDSTWLQADPKGNGFPGSSMQAKAFPGKDSSDKMDLPSEALSYGLYDWLRHQGLMVDRQSVVNAFGADLSAIAREGKTGKVLGISGKSRHVFDGSQSLIQPALAEDDPDNEVLDDSDDDDDFPVFGCIVSEDSMNSTYSSLLNADEAGTEYYLSSFNYDIAWQMCPEESLSMLVDPVTGNAVTPAGNDIIECCKLVEGTIATNRAGNVGAYAGLRAAVEAKRALKVLRNALNDAKDIQKEELSNSPNPARIAEKEQSFASTAASADWTLPSLTKVVRPIANTISQVDDEVDRQRVIFQRAKNVKVNGTKASQKTYQLVRHLRKWSAKGVRQLDTTGSGEDGYMFVVKILGRSPRLINIFPDDATSIVRSKPGYKGPHFYDIDPYDDAGIDRFRDQIKNVQLAAFPGSEEVNEEVTEAVEKIPPGKFKGLPLTSGNNIMPGKPRKGKDEFRTWDSRYLGKKFMIGYNSKSADTHYKDIKQLKADVYAAMEKLGLKVPKKYRTSTASLFIQSAYAQGQEELPIAQEKIFLLTGDNKGHVVINYQSGLEKYPFSQVKLQPGQMLYFANSALVQGTDPTKLTYRSVLSRDQFADLSNGKSYEKQGAGDWCHSNNYELGEGSSDRTSCPQMAGEWQLQPPFAVACCKLNPDKKHLGVKKGFNKWEILNTELDPEDRIPPEILAEMEQETSLCPPLIRKPIRKGNRPPKS